ncbi:hypothetical protein HPC50_02465 [Corallococcus exiguus]|uniref:hypothetical protein n=1 Tax=Corallococcus TaxID=83461 RepID=UPI0011C43818|nr:MULTISPECIES: hypothetical protein [Corallococcus]NPC45932.1 hypothetical protein [Corallococcus exiguus]NRD44926.1 hypothetical protein [Corallococcus exiguus]
MGLLLRGTPVNAAESEADTRIPEMELLCTDAVPPPVLDAAEDPRFVINRSGAVTLSKKKENLLMEFNLGGNAHPAWVQVERVTHKGVRHPVACGQVDDGMRYRLPEADPETEKDVLVVRLFDLPRSAVEQARLRSVREEREKVLLTPGIIESEQAALRDWAEVGLVAKTVEQFALSTDGKEEVLAKAVIANALSIVAQLGAACPGAGSAASGPALLNKLCEENRSLDSQLGTVSEALDRYSRAMRDAALKERRTEFRVALRAAAETLKPGARLEGEAREAHCTQIAMLNWLHDDERPHLVAQVELPLVDGARIVEATYGGGDSRQDLSSGMHKPLAVLLHDVTSGVELGVGTQQVITGRNDAADAVAGAFSFMIRLAKLAPGALPAAVGGKVFPAAHRELDFSVKAPTLICLDQTTAPAGASERVLKATLKADMGAPPLARIGTRTLVVEPLDKGSRREVYVCDAKPCEPSKDNVKVRNRVILDADQGSSFLLLVEVAGTAAMEGQGGFTTPRYAPLGSSAGPQRVYELRGDYRTQDLASVSVLFGVRLSRSWLLAGGPSVLVGTSGGTFSQLGLRAGWEFARGVVLTTGPSLRFVQTATKEAPLGSRIALANGEEPKVPAPPGLEYQPRFGWSVGLGVDASVLTDAGKSLLKSVGVTE